MPEQRRAASADAVPADDQDGIVKGGSCNARAMGWTATVLRPTSGRTVVLEHRLGADDMHTVLAQRVRAKDQRPKYNQLNMIRGEVV